MTALLLALVALAAFALLAGWLRQKRYAARGEEVPEVQPAPGADECCGQHETCEKDSLLAAVSKQIEYYDDEELDRFRGTASEAYSDEAVEEFQDILYTMQSDEVAGWVRSLQLRGIELPDPLKDEVFMIIGERRERH